MGSVGGGGGGDPKPLPPTPQEKELAKIGREKFRDFESRFIPMENRLIGQILGLGQPAEAQRLRGMAHTDVMRSSRSVNGIPGVDPSGGRAVGLNLDRLQDLTARDTAARGAAQEGAQQRYTGGLTNMVGLGRNLEGMGLANLKHSAALAGSRQIAESQSDYLSGQAVQGALGSAAGLAASAWFGRGNGIQEPPAPAPQVRTQRGGFDDRLITDIY